MLFSSNLFLFLFLPVTIGVYYLMGRKLKNMWLLAMSLLFYAWGEPSFVWVMIGSILFNYLISLIINHFRGRPAPAKAFLIVGVVGNLSVLFIFKYLDFVLYNISLTGADVRPLGLVLPIGISFFTFQAMSYMIDVYRGAVAVQKNPGNVGLYVSFFPQLIAGPIVRYTTIEKQIVSRRETLPDFAEGVKRFIVGLAKKIILANNLALIVDSAFELQPSQLSVSYAWLGAVAFGLQVYFDFSGYSDMAIGLGRMFGFHFLENFNYPFISKSASEFWRRWHISLGQWFRDYVYFPLGGSRVSSRGRLVFNLFIVWLLTGLWHGANWTFLLWGMVFFVLITLEKLTGWPANFKGRWPALLYTVFFYVCLTGSWVIFRADSLGAAGGYLMAMAGIRAGGFWSIDTAVALREHGVILLAAALCCAPLAAKLKQRLQNGAPWRQVVLQTVSLPFYLFIFLWSVSYLIMGAHNPFIYFNF